MLVFGAEYFERTLALGRLGNRRARETDNRSVRHCGHHVGAEVLGNGAMRLVNKNEDIVAHAAVFADSLKLVNHRDDQPAKIGIEQTLELGLGIGALGDDVEGLHFA